MVMARVDDNVAACGYCPSNPHVNQEPELVPSNPSPPLKPPSVLYSTPYQCRYLANTAGRNRRALIPGQESRHRPAL